MRIPLHLDPYDYSPAACAKRLDLHIEMAKLNPRGFRQPSAKSRQTTRAEWLAAIAYGDDAALRSGKEG